MGRQSFLCAKPPSSSPTISRRDDEHPPSGHTVSVGGASLLTLEDGKIRRSLRIWDMAGLLRGIKLLPELCPSAMPKMAWPKQRKAVIADQPNERDVVENLVNSWISQGVPTEHLTRQGE